MPLHRPVALLLALLPAGASAQSTQPLPAPLAALQDCRGKADAERLACYDKAVEALAAASASQQVVVIDRAEVKKARKGLFGFTMPRIGFLAGRKDNAEDEADARELTTAITAARSLGYGKWRFTVDDGAVWETTEANIGFNDPGPGRTVVLTRGAMGGYFAKVDGGRRVAAKRVQ